MLRWFTIRMIFCKLLIRSLLFNLTLLVWKNTFFRRAHNRVCVYRSTTNPSIGVLTRVSFRPTLKLITLPHGLNFSRNRSLRSFSSFYVQLAIVDLYGVFTTHVSFIPLYLFYRVLLGTSKSTDGIVSCGEESSIFYDISILNNISCYAILR